jgi:hypothetical protein
LEDNKLEKPEKETEDDFNGLSRDKFEVDDKVMGIFGLEENDGKVCVKKVK